MIGSAGQSGTSRRACLKDYYDMSSILISSREFRRTFLLLEVCPRNALEISRS